jgi:hypothetical protein
LRLSKIQVVSVTLACLLFSGSAQGQFGKLKALATDKLNRQVDRQTDKQVDKQIDKLSGQAKGDQSQPTGSFGEAKATFASGVKRGKSLEVSRQRGGTPEAGGASRQGSSNPEANIAPIEYGRSQEISIKVSHVDARQLDLVRGYRPCTKIKDFQVLSATQMKATIDLTGNKSSGTCALSFVSGGSTVFSTNVSIRAKK